MQKSVLVTGGAGYVGSIVVAELLSRGYRVRVLDALLHGSTPSLLQSWGNPRFEFIHADVRDSAARAEAVQGINAVVHLAAIVGDPACTREPELAREVNLNGTKALLADAEHAGVERFVFASTCSNYGRMSNNGFADESFKLAPVSLYAETKVAAEEEVLSPSRALASTCLRFATVFGTSPRMRFDLTVNEFTGDLAVSDELVVFGEQCERFPNGNVKFVQRDEDPRDYRVSFQKFAERFEFAAERSVADGIDEVVGLLESGFVTDPFAPTYRN